MGVPIIDTEELRMLTVYQVMKQSDMAAGNGYMIPDLCFSTEQHAWDYVNQQTGIMGRTPNSGKWQLSGFKDWDVKEVRVYHSVEESEQEKLIKKKEKALSKLTEEEKEILGLVYKPSDEPVAVT